MTANNTNFNNKKIVITRPIERSESLAKIIREYNGDPIIIPTLELHLVESPELINIVDNINTFDWIIFTSPAGVESFFNLCDSKKLSCKIAVIGVKTQEELEKHGLSPDLVPEKFTAEGLLKSFKSIDIKDKKIALPRTLSARKVLPEGLEEYGAEVVIAEAYTSGIPKDKTDMLKLVDMILNKEIDIITFTSPLTVLNLIELIKEERKDDLQTILNILGADVIIGSIGPITSNVLYEFNIKTVEPDRYTVKNMIEALLETI